LKREKPLPWMAFVGCLLSMVSVLLVFGINLYLAGGSSSIYKSQPLANIAGVVLLILGIILTVVGFRKSE
jgi:hypothetical protein